MEVQMQTTNNDTSHIQDITNSYKRGSRDLDRQQQKGNGKKQRASTILIANNNKFRKDSMMIDLQKDPLYPSIPNYITESSTKGVQANALNFTQTIIIPNDNASQLQNNQQFQRLLDEEREAEEAVRRKPRSQSMKYFNTTISNESDEYFKEDKDSMKNSQQKSSELGQVDLGQIIQNKDGVIPEQPPEYEISPGKKKKSSQNDQEKKQESSPFVTDKEIKDPPRDLIFRWNQFLEFLLYHIIYYMFGSIIGLLILAIILRRKNIRTLRNLGFYGIKQIQKWELLFSNLFFSTFILMIYYIKELSKVYVVEIVLLFIVLIQRAIIITVKYGFMLPQKFQIYKTKILTREQLMTEYLLGEWTEEKDKVIDKELNLAMSRLEIEKSSFYLCFIVQPSDDKLKELLNPNSQSYGIGDLDFQNNPYGPKLIKVLINHFNENYSFKKYRYFSIFVAVAKQIIFLSMKLLTPQFSNQCLSNCVFEYFILFSNTLSDYYLTQTFIMFTAISQRHLKRIIYVMNQLSHMISAKKVEEYEEKKLYPTLNLTSDLSIRSWFHLRNLTLDFGQKFYKRIEYIISFLFLFNFIFMAIIFLINFNIIPNPGTNINLYFKLYSIYCSFWLILLMWDIRLGAQINKHFKIHKLFLMKNLSIIEDICSNYFLYFDQNAQCENFMYRELVKYFKETHKDVDFSIMANVVHHLRPILNSLEGGIEQIEFYEKYKPFKMMGIPVSNNLLAKLILFILSLCGSVLASIYVK
ncbi:hypothetical protein ABPG74_012251 [Tetrahymena malaccensis]